MRTENLARMIGCLVLSAMAWNTAIAEKTTNPVGEIHDTVALPPVPSRIVERIDESRVTVLAGNKHPMAKPEFDLGVVDPQLPMERMVLLLRRSPEQEAALEQFMAEQLDPKSPNFHHWLDAKEFGALYGVSESDIQTVSSWLQNHGFRVDSVSNSRIFLHFSGTAAQVQETFHTEMHRYNVRGEAHISNNVDPSIPEALSPVVVGIKSLNDFFPKPAHVNQGEVRRDGKTGQWHPVDESNDPKPAFYISNGTGETPYQEVTPWDFATIYNVLPLWNAGIDGTGVTIALAGRSDINLADVATFRSAFGLPANVPNIIVNGPDPGIPAADDKVENSLDVEWSGAVAKGATIDLVTTKTTATEDGAEASALYIVDASPTFASVMSYSYQNCELGGGTAGNAAINSIWQQGAAEGISEFVAAGDYAAAQCDGGQNSPYEAEYGLEISGLSSGPYDTAVGGTDFNWVNNTSKTYWNTSNASNGLSALGYIPEVPWNQTCASDAIDEYIGATGAGLDSEQTCQYLITNNLDEFLVNVVGGSGGKSSCYAPTSDTLASCAAHGGYPKPSWQTGVGVPNDGVRDVPDVSLFASANALYSAYLLCDSDSGPCTYSNASDAEMQGEGGTSVASPALAGILAMVVQKTGSAQGLANPVFYQLAAKDNRANCASNTVVAGNACNFYDITTDNNAVPCAPNSVDCTVLHSGDTLGIMTGNLSTTGFDLTTGLGTVNAANLVNNWPGVPPTLKVSLSPTTLAFASTTVGATTAAQVVTVKNTGTGAVTLTSETLTGTGASSFLISANTCTTSLAAGASCTVSVEFKPASAATFSASLSVADNATGSPQTVALSGTGTNPQTLTVTLSPTTLAFASTTVGNTTVAQVVTVKNTGTEAASLTSETLTGTGASSFLISANTCTTSLAAGASCAVSVEFKPASAAAFSASLSVADNATGSPQTVALSGTGTPPVTGGTLSVTPASLSFASTAVGSVTAPLQVIVKNTGTTAVTFTGFTYTGANTSSFVESGINCGTTLAAGATCAVAIEFKPQTPGALTATLNIADNATGSPQTVALSGTGTVPTGSGTLTITPASLSLTYASTAVGSVTAPQQVIVKNTGTTTVTFTGFTYTGANTSSFVQSGINCGTTLAAGAACAVAIEFKPQSSGALTATLNIADNATGSPQKVTLSGTGTGGTVATVTLSPTSLAFPNTIVGSTSDAQVVTLTNTGSVSVTVSSITLAGASPSSYLDLSNCGATLAASASCSIYVAFKPASAAALAATLSVADTATGSPQTVALTGTGTAAPSVKLSATSLAFGTVAHGTTSAAQALTLTNSGTATLTLSSITLTGTGAADFEALNTCAATLAPSASCTVYVAFKPAAAAAYTATLSIADNGSASPQSVALSGTGN